MSDIAHLPKVINNDGNDTIAANVRAELGYLNRSQASLAEALGMSDMSLSRRLNSQTLFTSIEIVAIAEHFDIPVAELFVKKGRPLNPVGPTGIEPMTSTVDEAHFADILPFTRRAVGE